jgi:hypothetical protein
MSTQMRTAESVMDNAVDRETGAAVEALVGWVGERRGEIGAPGAFVRRWRTKAPTPKPKGHQHDGGTPSGRLHRIHRGIYAVGHPGPSQEGGWMAAVLACGDGAVLATKAPPWRLPTRPRPRHDPRRRRARPARGDRPASLEHPPTQPHDDATAAGYVILRFAWRQLTEDAATVAATVRSVLGKQPPSQAGATLFA